MLLYVQLPDIYRGLYIHALNMSVYVNEIIQRHYYVASLGWVTLCAERCCP